MRVAASLPALLALSALSCASLAPGSVSVADLAGAADRYDNTHVQVRGVICDVEPHASLQLGSACKDMVGISLELSPGTSLPQPGTAVVVSGLFRDHSKGDGSPPHLLNYPKNRYLGNYSISVRELRVLGNGPNIHSSRSRFAARLSSGVRPHVRQSVRGAKSTPRRRAVAQASCANAVGYCGHFTGCLSDRVHRH